MKRNSVLNSSQELVIAPKRTGVVSFTFYVPSHLSLAKVTTTAQGQQFSDGEEVVLPVLPNRMLVTESLPFYVRGKQQNTLNFQE
jgi:hypothetical protein